MLIRCIFYVLMLLVLPIQAHAQEMLIPKLEEDIAYGKDPLQKLDIYSPRALSKPAPVLVFVHGGGWTNGDKSMAKRHGLYYARRGVVLVSFNYRLSPKDNHPAQVKDCAAAMKWVVDNIRRYNGDVKNIHVSGHSAGAHLVALLATDPSYLKAHGLQSNIMKTVIPLDSASYDLVTDLEGIGARRVNRLVDRNFGASEQEKRDASPLYHVQKAGKQPVGYYPAFEVFVTGRRPDAVEQTKSFVAALKKAGAPAQAHVIEDRSHRDMNLELSDESSPIAKRVAEILWP